MSDVRLSDLGQISGPIKRSSQNVLLDDGTNTKRALLSQLLGSGAGAANALTFKEEITEITQEMWDSIANGDFNAVHVGMHYTAPSGRTYYFADADYYFGKGYPTEQTHHHMLVIEDEIQHTAQHQTTNVTTGGAASSLIYTSTLPSYQGELEADFGASHILDQDISLTNAVSSGIPSGQTYVTKKCLLLCEKQVFGNDIRYTHGATYFYNSIIRERQLALFKNMPETIVARAAGTTNRSSWWLDDVESAAGFGFVVNSGAADPANASLAFGVRRAFLIG